MKTSLTLSISSISISVLFWGGILLVQASGDGATAIALGLAWFFLGCPVILTLTIIALVTAFKKPKPAQGASQGAWVAQPMKAAKIVSVISVLGLALPVLIGTVIIPMLN